MANQLRRSSPPHQQYDGSMGPGKSFSMGLDGRDRTDLFSLGAGQLTSGGDGLRGGSSGLSCDKRISPSSCASGVSRSIDGRDGMADIDESDSTIYNYTMARIAAIVANAGKSAVGSSSSGSNSMSKGGGGAGDGRDAGCAPGSVAGVGGHASCGCVANCFHCSDGYEALSASDEEEDANAAPNPQQRERVVGVTYDKAHNRWVASWFAQGMKKVVRYFSAHRYGDTQAHKMAVQARRDAETRGEARVRQVSGSNCPPGKTSVLSCMPVEWDSMSGAYERTSNSDGPGVLTGAGGIEGHSPAGPAGGAHGGVGKDKDKFEETILPIGGVAFDDRDKPKWFARWRCRRSSRTMVKRFSVSTYGFTQAMLLAIEARCVAETKNALSGGSLPLPVATNSEATAQGQAERGEKAMKRQKYWAGDRDDAGGSDNEWGSHGATGHYSGRGRGENKRGGKRRRQAAAASGGHGRDVDSRGGVNGCVADGRGVQRIASRASTGSAAADRDKGEFNTGSLSGSPSPQDEVTPYPDSGGNRSPEVYGATEGGGGFQPLQLPTPPALQNVFGGLSLSSASAPPFGTSFN
eukprot:Selendium_serpulae@DN4558_c0_g2_i1.p1